MSTLENYIESENYDKAIQHINQNYDNETFLKKSEKKIVKIYNSHIKDGEIDKAASVFNGIISQTYHVSLEETDKVTEAALEEIEDLEVSFKKGKNDFEEIKTLLTGYQTFNHTEISEKATAALEKIEKINNSKIGFNDGNKYYENKDYGKAIISYNMVDAEDDNFKAAQAKIEEIKGIYKTEVFAKLDSMISANKYDEALEELNTLLEIGEDAEVTAKIDFVTAAQKKYLKEQAKKDQTVVVTGVRVYNANRYSNNMAAEVIIKNNSDKVVKNANIVIASFDKNGYAVNIEYPTLYGAEYDHMLRGSMSTINLLPGESYGKNRYYDSLADEATKAHAIVKSVEFVDGSTWENPYYDYWVEECKDHY
jgi:tetratricopeptide (TPR) repeat protein